MVIFTLLLHIALANQDVCVPEKVLVAQKCVKTITKCKNLIIKEKKVRRCLELCTKVENVYEDTGFCKEIKKRSKNKEISI